MNIHNMKQEFEESVAIRFLLSLVVDLHFPTVFQRNTNDPFVLIVLELKLQFLKRHRGQWIVVYNG